MISFGPILLVGRARLGRWPQGAVPLPWRRKTSWPTSFGVVGSELQRSRAANSLRLGSEVLARLLPETGWPSAPTSSYWSVTLQRFSKARAGVFANPPFDVFRN